MDRLYRAVRKYASEFGMLPERGVDVLLTKKPFNKIVRIAQYLKTLNVVHVVDGPKQLLSLSDDVIRQSVVVTTPHTLYVEKNEAPDKLEYLRRLSLCYIWVLEIPHVIVYDYANGLEKFKEFGTENPGYGYVWHKDGRPNESVHKYFTKPNHPSFARERVNENEGIHIYKNKTTDRKAKKTLVSDGSVLITNNHGLGEGDDIVVALCCTVGMQVYTMDRPLQDMCKINSLQTTVQKLKGKAIEPLHEIHDSREEEEEEQSKQEEMTAEQQEQQKDEKKKKERENDVIYSLAVNQIMMNKSETFFENIGSMQGEKFTLLTIPDGLEAESWDFPDIRVANTAGISAAVQAARASLSPEQLTAVTRASKRARPETRILDLEAKETQPRQKQTKTDSPYSLFEELTLGVRIAVLWSRGEWYEGEVTGKDDEGFRVHYDDGDVVTHTRDERVTFMVLKPWNSELESVQLDCRVKVYWYTEKTWFEGRIVNKDEESFSVLYDIDGQIEKYTGNYRRPFELISC